MVLLFDHKKQVTSALKNYLNYIDWKIDKTKSLEYFKLLMSKCSIAHYKKQMYQIRKFLVHMGIEKSIPKIINLVLSSK